ncbi:hypothetical protein HYALB_00005084 [Hymenoscyphus albidus]|uniref:Uncharacterized protein n=1 Tax=Hymenoscyphus albidus TaxID=595503 RepID=A0A9N9PXH9_9HELO|nr:hypothetical protein HYALB_00005084 [Hymenoscyphus albidus]
MSKPNNQPNTKDHQDDQPNYPGFWPQPPSQQHSSHPPRETVPLSRPFGNPNDPAFPNRQLGTPPTAAAITRGFHGETVYMTPTAISQPDERPLAGTVDTARSGNAPRPENSLLCESMELQGYSGTLSELDGSEKGVDGSSGYQQGAKEQVGGGGGGYAEENGVGGLDQGVRQTGIQGVSCLGGKYEYGVDPLCLEQK